MRGIWVEKLSFYSLWTEDEIICSAQILRVLSTAKGVFNFEFQNKRASLVIPYHFLCERILTQILSLSSCVTWAMCSQYYGVMCSSPLWIIHHFLKLCKASYCAGSPRFWLTYIWNNSLVVISFLTQGLEIVWTLELTLSCFDKYSLSVWCVSMWFTYVKQVKDGLKYIS